LNLYNSPFLKKGDSVLDISKTLTPQLLKTFTLAEKKQLCKTIRKQILRTLQNTGGHLASNLGTVELTVALHAVFESPKDKIIFDVGHQAYTHKILTGRARSFKTIRTKGGISGFPRPEESEHDAFIGGHSSIAVSAALGIAKAMELKGEEGQVIAVVGDGALTGGEAFEGLNNAGKLQSNLIIILNDNQMSISHNTGALAKYLTHITATRKYYSTKNNIKKFLGKEAANFVSNTKKLLKYAIYKGNLFEGLGFRYLGPVDGHNLEDLIEVLQVAKVVDQPCVVHVKTKKGKGYRPAEQNAGLYHGVSKHFKNGGDETYSELFGKTLTQHGVADDRICAISAAMTYETGLNFFRRSHPDRFFDVGIAEQHAATFACGLAKEGMIPVFAVYSTFMQRCYDQIIHDAAIQKLHIVLGVDRAGLTGEDGETHQGIFDVPMLSTIPGTVIYSPSEAGELMLCLEKALFSDNGVTAVRYPKGVVEYGDPTLTTTEYSLKKTDSFTDTLVISYGRIALDALTLTQYKADVLKLVKIHPLPDAVFSIIQNYKNVIFFEESSLCGGIAERVGFMLLKNGFKGNYHPVGISGFVAAASVQQQLTQFGLTKDAMIKTVLKIQS
jgi:1-deoxy-D-xylulose-5-phosphate synthase